MSFVLVMALREIRASWKRLLFFFICIAIGVGSIVALRSVIQSVRAALARETRTLIASDILITSNTPVPDEIRALVAREAQAGRVSQTTDAVEIATMVRPADGRPAARMVELRAVQAGFPFYGTLTLRDGAYAHDRLTGRGALVRPELLAQLDLKVGDRILIGTQPFEIRGVIATEPGRSLGAFSLGNRLEHDPQGWTPGALPRCRGQQRATGGERRGYTRRRQDAMRLAERQDGDEGEFNQEAVEKPRRHAGPIESRRTTGDQTTGWNRRHHSHARVVCKHQDQPGITKAPRSTKDTKPFC